MNWVPVYCICVVVDAESVLYGVRGNQEIDLDELTFKLVVRSRDKPDPGPPYTVTLMAPSAQEKAAWTSDISQVSCLCHLFTSYQSELRPRPQSLLFLLAGEILTWGKDSSGYTWLDWFHS